MLSERERFEEYIRRSREAPTLDVDTVMAEVVPPEVLLSAMLAGWDPPAQKDRGILGEVMR